MARNAAKLCAYCAQNPGVEGDHVLAKQLFPAELLYRDRPAIVPACGKCNREKQKHEDSVGTILQFGHDSDASRKVLDDRVPRTLQKNARLSRALREGMRWEWRPEKSGLLAKRLVINISDEERFHINQWFRFLSKGLYYYETNQPLPRDRKLYLFKPVSQDEFEFCRSFILDTEAHEERSLANGEFYYAVALAADNATTAWQFAFKSVDVFAFTTSTKSAVLAKHDWNEPRPKTKRVAGIVRLR